MPVSGTERCTCPHPSPLTGTYTSPVCVRCNKPIRQKLTKDDPPVNPFELLRAAGFETTAQETYDKVKALLKLTQRVDEAEDCFCFYCEHSKCEPTTECPITQVKDLLERGTWGGRK